VSGAGWRPVGFALLMLGFGLRLDTAWQGLAWLFLVGGAAAGAAGLWDLARRGRLSPFRPAAGQEIMPPGPRPGRNVPCATRSV
jgi:hypothetical protein